MTPAARGRALRAAAVAVLAGAAGLLAGLAPAARASPAPPTISAPAAIVMEASTHDVAFRRDADERRPIASTTKLMTALLTIRHASLTDTFVAPEYDATPAESRIDLRAGEGMRVRDLLRALLLASANDAAVTLAQGVAGSTARFVRWMNREARRLQLRNTSYANPVGLDDPANFSSARDLATLAIALRRSAFARRTTNLERATLRTGDRVRRIVNRNTLVRKVPAVDGMKTGYTSGAGYILVGSATRGPITVVSAVLGEPSDLARQRDTLALLRWGLARYKFVRPVVGGAAAALAGVRLGGDARVPLIPSRSAAFVVRRGRAVRAVVSAPRELRGPLPVRRRVGTIVVREGRRVLDRVPLVTARPVPGPTTVERLKAAARAPWVILGAGALGLIVICSLVLAFTRRRAKTFA
jgi:D-alanyl-D-alanine carboxypeptidase (penicillin-binding protein 5/6)